jgi:two-component system sensor histidine kinase/response regulator
MSHSLGEVFENAADALFIAEKASGIILDANVAASRLMQMPHEKIIGMHQSQLHPNCDNNFFNKHLDDLDKNVSTVPLEGRVKCFDGSEIDVEILASQMVYDGKQCIMGAFRDINLRKQAEQSLIQNEEKSRLLIKNSNDIILIVNENGEQFFISDAVENITGYTAEELYGNILDVIHPEDVELVTQHWNEVLSNPNKSSRVQYRHKHKVRGFVWLEAVAQEFLENPSIKGVIVNIRDITAHKESETKLKELNATKDKLFSIIAHDLKSPFNGLLGFSEILNENIRTFPIEKSEEIITTINSTAKQTLVLLENLLTWANTQTGQFDFKPENQSLKPIIQAIVVVLNSSASIKNITINSFLSDDITAYADLNMLKTVLRNLISNAIKFTDSGGKVDINTVSDKNQIKITVADDGVGMNEETISKLFRIDATLTTKGTANESGSGLGLILCKEFVEKHGGKIWIESEVGKGSKFVFTLPLSTK